MIDIGQLLRQTREAQGLSLAEVEEATRIRQQYLNALESGDWEDLPNPIVARGFLRTYAEFLDLDADEILAELDGEQPSENEEEDQEAAPAVVPAGPEYQPIDLTMYETEPGRDRRGRRILGIILVLIPVLILALLITQFALPFLLDQSGISSGQSTDTTPLPPAATPHETPMIVVGGANPETVTAVSSSVAATEAPDATPSPTPSPTATSTPTPVNTLVLRVEATQRAWTQLQVDDVVVLEEILLSGFDQTYVATQTLRFLTGNAAGIILTFNDEEVPELGEPGEVVAFIWTIEDGLIVFTTPTPEPTFTPSPTGTITPESAETPSVDPTAEGPEAASPN